MDDRKKEIYNEINKLDDFKKSKILDSLKLKVIVQILNINENKMSSHTSSSE